MLYDNGAVPKSALEIAENAEVAAQTGLENARVDLQTTAEHLKLLGSDVDHPSGIVEVTAPFRGSHHRSGNHRRGGSHGIIVARSLHHLRHVARLDCLRRV